jgi:uncharacterized protein (DUF1697 family)
MASATTKYLALLRGINVGQNMLRMERLRELCADIALGEPRTYLQSGNLVFESRQTAAGLAKALENKLVGETRLPVTVIVRSAEAISSVLEANPFLGQRSVDEAKLHITFLQRTPEKSAVEALQKIAAGADEFRWAGTEIYLHCPGGYGETKLSNGTIERFLGMRATTRNWRTVTKLCEMCTK